MASFEFVSVFDRPESWQLDTDNCLKLGISSDTVKFCNGYWRSRLMSNFGQM